MLSPLAQELTSFINDTPQFLQIINDFEFPANANHKPLLFTMDVTSLYTSIPHDGALKASKHFLDKRSNQSISTSTLLQVTELVLDMNTLHFNGRHFSQKHCVDMETKMGPSVACIFMGYLEELFLPIMNTPHQCYISDILTPSLELPHVLKKNYNVSLII